jgi:hypothetical protein
MSLDTLKDKICNSYKDYTYEKISKWLDYLVQEEPHKSKHKYLVNTPDKQTFYNDTTYKNKNDTMRGDYDFHCWVVRDDGSIYNPEFNIYNDIKRRWDIDPNEPMILEPFSKELQLECLKTVIDTLKVQVLDGKIDDIDENMLMYLFVKKPMFGRCWSNSYYYKKLYGGKFVIGRMGWRKKDGTIYYEFG